MRTSILSVVATLCLVGALSAVNTNAQEPGTELRFDIPFSFHLRGEILPSGNYVVRRLSEGPAVLEIQSRRGQDTVIFDTFPVVARNTPGDSELVFHRYGNQYFLEEVFTGGNDTGRELPPSRSERSLKREVARNMTNGRAETIEIAAD
jgi:hypothetical protein